MSQERERLALHKILEAAGLVNSRPLHNLLERLSGVDTVEELRCLPIDDLVISFGATVLVRGKDAPYDTEPRHFSFHPASTLDDDGEVVITPIPSTIRGRWHMNIITEFDWLANDHEPEKMEREEAEVAEAFAKAVATPSADLPEYATQQPGTDFGALDKAPYIEPLRAPAVTTKLPEDQEAALDEQPVEVADTPEAAAEPTETPVTEDDTEDQDADRLERNLTP